MALKFTLSQIYHTGKDGLLEILQPGSVQRVNDEDVPALEKGGHVREPSADELALYKLANPQPTETVSNVSELEKTNPGAPEGDLVG